MQTSTRQAAGRFARIFAAGLILFAALRDDFARIAAAPADNPPAAGSPPGPRVDVGRSDEKARTRESVSALMMWCGIIAAGVGLLAMTVLWGSRLRRALRRRIAPPTTVDAFWYLKKKRPLAAAPPQRSNGGEPGGPGDTGATPGDSPTGGPNPLDPP